MDSCATTESTGQHSRASVERGERRGTNEGLTNMAERADGRVVCEMVVPKTFSRARDEFQSSFRGQLSSRR